MIARLVIVIAACWINLAHAADASARLEGQLAKIEALTGQFKQTLYDPKGGKLQASQGEFAVKQPGFFYWEAADPYPQVLVGTPEQLWIFDPDLEQATLRKSDPYAEFNPSQLLSGGGKALGERFTVEHSVKSGADQYVLVPREPGASYKHITLVFDRDKPKAMAFTDQLNQLTEIEFLKVALNKKVPDSRFEFTPPAGTDIVVDGQ